MIKVQLKTNTLREDINADITSTPASVFDTAGVGTAGSSINLNGTILTATDLNSTFEALGIADGTTANLNCVIKADGAR